MTRRPVGEPATDDFEVRETDTPQPGDDEVLVDVQQISLDPAMRGWMSDVPSYLPPVGLGEVMRAGVAGVVRESNSDRLAPGDYVVGMLGVQEQAVAHAKAVTKVDTGMAPLACYLGGLGMPGLTAYFGLTEVGELKEGDTVVISGAAGAVGSVAGQIAKAKGAGNVVGIAGGAEKCGWIVDELGFDAALANLAMHARVVICGAISQYNAAEGMQGPRNYMMLLVRRSRMQGFLVFDYAKQYGDALREMAAWRDSGVLKTHEEIVEGSIEDFQPTLMKLFRGENTGKLVLQIG